MEQATVSSVGGRPEIKVTNRILAAGQGIRPSGYPLASKNNYNSLILRVAYKVNGNLQEVSRTFTVGMREEEKPPSAPEKASVGPTATQISIQLVEPSDISDLYKITTRLSCRAPSSSKVIYTFKEDTQADFNALLNTTDSQIVGQKQSKSLWIGSNAYRFKPVTAKPFQYVKQDSFNVSPSDQLLACVNGTTGNEEATIWLRVKKAWFVQLPKRVEFVNGANKCIIELVGGELDQYAITAGEVILDFYRGDISAGQILLKELPTPYRSCIEFAPNAISLVFGKVP